MPFEHGPERRRRSFCQSMYVLDQGIDVGSHHQQIPRRTRPGIPISVGSPTRDKHRGPSPRLDVIGPHAHAQRPLEHVPSLIIIAMKMQRCNPTWGSGRTPGILPLGNDEIAASRSDDGSSQRRSDDRRTHTDLKDFALDDNVVVATAESRNSKGAFISPPPAPTSPACSRKDSREPEARLRPSAKP